MDKIEKLFGKEFAEKLENTRDNIQTYNDLILVEDRIHNFASFIENCSDKGPSFNCRIKVVDDNDNEYTFFTSGKEDCTSNIGDQIDFINLTPEEKEQFNEFCAKLVIKHIEHLFELRKNLSDKLGETE